MQFVQWNILMKKNNLNLEDTTRFKKFEIKDVLLDINSVMKNRDTLSSAWRDQLGHQMKDLPDFEEVFTAVLSIVDSYEKMGNSS